MVKHRKVYWAWFLSFVTLFRFTISIQGFIACSILATENEHLASLISWKYTSQMIYHRGGEPERAMHC